MAKKNSPEHIADELYLAMKGFGTDEDRIIRSIGGLDPETIQEARHAFEKKYHKDLIKEIKSETSGNFEDALVALLKDPAEYDAWLLHDSLAGLGTKDHQLIEVLVSRHPEKLAKAKIQYQKLYNKPLEEAISGDTSGDYRKYLLALAAGTRNSSAGKVDEQLVEKDISALYSAGEGRVGTNEDAFIEIFAQRSYKHIRHVAEGYTKKHTHSLLHAIEKEFSGDLLKALKWSLEFMEDKQAFFAKRIHGAFKGIGTHDDALVRIIVSRRPVDLFEIAEAYYKLYNRSLKEAITDETSGDYRKLLVEMLTEA